MLAELQGKTALVTGAGSGIGRALAERLGAEGMRVVACDIDAPRLIETGAALTQAGVSHLTAPLDIRDRSAWLKVVAHAESVLGPVQLLCNNAGVTIAPTGALDTGAEAWNWVIDTNLNGTFHGVGAVGNRLRELGLPGHIVNTASIQGLLAALNFSAYNAAKFAIVGFSETLRLELAAFGIGVSVLCPGATRTNMMTSSRGLAPQWFPVAVEKPRVGFTNYRTAEQVAQQTVDAIRANRFYIVTHPEYRPLLEARWRALDACIGSDIDADAMANVLDIEQAILAGYTDMAESAR